MSYHRFYFNCQFSVLTLLRRLFLLAARHSVQAPSALAPHRRFRFQFSVFIYCPPLSISLPSHYSRLQRVTLRAKGAYGSANSGALRQGY